MTEASIFVRADGGPDIGYGHLVRTGALAERLLDRGHAVTYVTTTPAGVEAVCPADCKVVEIASRDDPDALAERIEIADAVLVDSYRADAEYQRLIRDEAPLAVIVDDDKIEICADLLVNGNLHARDLEYNVTEARPDCCLGPQYLPLRSSITRLAESDPPWRDPPERALVTMGGSDTARLTPAALRAFKRVDVRVDAVVGPGFSDEQEAEMSAVIDEVSINASMIKDPPDLARRMFDADFAVCTASSTSYELMALGTPIVACPVADNQDPIAAAITDRGIGQTIARGERTEAICRAVVRYANDETCRRRHRRRGRELVDGQGSERVCDELLSIAGLNSDP